MDDFAKLRMQRENDERVYNEWRNPWDVIKEDIKVGMGIPLLFLTVTLLFSVFLLAVIDTILRLLRA